MTSQAADGPETVAASSRSKLTREREQEFFDAVLEQIRECGYESVTMEGVAASTRCSKSTLYRQWKTKPQFVVAALRSRRQSRFGGIDTGSLADDLREAARAVGRWSTNDTKLLQALGHAVTQDVDLAKALREALVDPEIAALRRSSSVASSAARSSPTIRRWSTSRRRCSASCAPGPSWTASTRTPTTWSASWRPPCCRHSASPENQAAVHGMTGR